MNNTTCLTYLGNYDIVPSSWIDKVLSTQGEIRPNEKTSTSKEKNNYILNQKKMWEDAGIDTSSNGAARWEMFYRHDFDADIDFQSIDHFKNKNVLAWWIVKINPGRCFPFHYDSFDKKFDKNLERYWISLQDHHWGHIFIIENEILTNYKKGDAFKFEDTIHASANVGLIPKISLQLVVSNN